MLTEFEQGYILGLLVGEGHFGGDGQRAQITLKMHIRHKSIFDWLQKMLPGGRLYGPYEHDSRKYYVWTARGPYLRNVLVPFLAARQGYMDDHVRSRFLAMCARYAIDISRIEPEDGSFSAADEWWPIREAGLGQASSPAFPASGCCILRGPYRTRGQSLRN